MDGSTIVLIFTGLAVIIAVIIVLYLYFQFIKRVNEKSQPSPNNLNYCIAPGRTFDNKAPTYTRRTMRVSPSLQPMISNKPFQSSTSTVIPNDRTRSIRNSLLLPTNYYNTQMFYGEESGILNIFPYFVNIMEKYLVFSWPDVGVVTKTCNLMDCPTGEANLSYTNKEGLKLSLSSLEETILSTDITDFDPLITRLTYSAQSTVTAKYGSFTVPLCRGSPYITTIIDNVGVSLASSYNITQESDTNELRHVLRNGNSNNGYVIYLSRPIRLTLINNIVYFPRFTGIMRIAYFNSQNHLSILDQYSNIYADECTLTVENNYEDYSFNFKTTNMNENTNESFLFAVPPHLNVLDSINSYPQTGNGISPYTLVTSDDNIFKFNSTFDVPDFDYPAISNNNLKTVWDVESVNILKNYPSSMSDFFKLMFSIANLIQIGNAAEYDTSALTTRLIQNLTQFSNNSMIYDETWKGIVSQDGMFNCNANVDGGNSFYTNTLSDYGYLMYAYAVAVSISPSNTLNRDIMVSLLRQVVNYSYLDNNYSFLRYKDWYFGFSGTIGVDPNPLNKATYNISEQIFAYYAAYHLSNLLQLEDAKNWSKLLLSTEINSINTYFRFKEGNLNVDSEFVQGTITEQKQNSYEYNLISGNSEDFFPMRNASIMISMMKPLSLLNVKNEWAIGTQQYMNAAMQGELSADSMLAAISLLAVDSVSGSNLENTIVNNVNNEVSLGWTWSSGIYWINQHQLN